MMENNQTPSPAPVPEVSPVAVPAPAESTAAPSPALPVIPLRELPNAPLLHKGFQNLFRLGIANIVINLLNNTFKLGDKIPALGIVLSAMSFAVSVLMLVVLWKLSAAVPRFRKVVYFNLLPLIALPFVALLDAPSVQEWITASDVSAILVVLIILLGLLFLFATLAAYHQLTACAEAFDGADDAMAAKWRSLCTWQVVVIGALGAFLILILLLTLSSASFFYFYNGSLIVLLLLFRNYREPVVILLMIPLIFIGVVLGLAVTGKVFNFFSLLGLLGLVGMNIKNAVVLVEQIGVLRSEGKGAYEALTAATRSRIVPVAMASGTTILGMLPLAIGTGAGSVFGAMAATIMGGLLVATLLTVCVLPVVYAIFYNIRKS